MARGFRWTESEVIRALGSSEAARDERVFAGVSTDSRRVGSEALFVALRGERFDGHDFLERAAAAGATGAIVERVPTGAPATLRYFLVEDTGRALLALARHRRSRLQARVAAIVGSNGKTTTKELLRGALAGSHKVHATAGNQNNQIGVPLTILSAPDDADVLVVEMGTNEPGEIRVLTRIVQPHAALITSIGEEHLEKLGSLAGVLEEEVAVLEGLAVDGLVVVPEEPAALVERARAIVSRGRTLVAGFSSAADLRPDGGGDGLAVEPDGTTRWLWRGVPVQLRLPGRWNVRNALLAIGLAEAWGVAPEQAVRGVESVAAPPLRGEWRAVGRLRVLADCYNANPASLLAAVELFASLRGDGSKIAVLGTMRELGAESPQVHERCAAAIVRSSGDEIDLIVATGSFASAFEPFRAALGSRLVTCSDPLDAYRVVRARLEGCGLLLLKASRGEALERWLPLLEADFAGRA